MFTAWFSAPIVLYNKVLYSNVYSIDLYSNVYSIVRYSIATGVLLGHDFNIL